MKVLQLIHALHEAFYYIYNYYHEREKTNPR